MGKTANRFLEVHPWKVVENGYHPASNQVSESIFSLANEYSGIRGFFDEGVSNKSLIGTYYNGLYVYAPDQIESAYRGITNKVHYMINSANWVKSVIYADGEKLDLAKIDFSDFIRELDFKTGELKRSFVWKLKTGKQLTLIFKRLLNMEHPQYGYQVIELQAHQDAIHCELELLIDFSIVHWGKFNFWSIVNESHLDELQFMVGKLPTDQLLFSGFSLSTSKSVKKESINRDKIIGQKLTFNLEQNEHIIIERRATNLIDKQGKESVDKLTENGIILLDQQPNYHDSYAENHHFYENYWHNIDIEIDGDDENQQGVRFCLFQLTQTYHGYDPTNNIGAKGLTGEAYSGHAFWDTETYCLPFYLFNHSEAAKNLLIYRYHTLSMAKERAIELDCKGAAYPIATLNGYESCNLWQHASLQPQPSSAVAYGIMHYIKNTHDKVFMENYGLEMMIEISRYLFSRGDYNADHTKFGFYGVMGPDEFQMMVNHNTYTNLMGKYVFEDTLKELSQMRMTNREKYRIILNKTGLTAGEIRQFRDAAKLMYVSYDSSRKIYEQHQGYFDLPHLDVDSIPETDFPLYHHWTYDRIYRNDMIKQPDVLMLMFLHNQKFPLSVKKANYEFYEPRCIHESSLSPSIHSVLAMELGKTEEALSFFHFATRMDLDDYNRNASEGLHLTSIAAAWVNIIYGFGGLRSDGSHLTLNPKIPSMWNQYRFKIKYFNSLISVLITKENVSITVDKTLEEPIKIYGHLHQLTEGVHIFKTQQ